MKPTFLPYQSGALVILFLLCAAILSAQNQDRVVKADYDRVSVSYVTLNYASEKHQDAFLQEFSKMTTGDKYFFNDLGYRVVETKLSKVVQLTANQEYEQSDKSWNAYKSYWKQLFKTDKKVVLAPFDTVGQRIQRELIRKKVGSDVLKIWANQDDKGNFNTLLERSKYNLSSSDLKRDEDYKRLTSFRQLFFQNYILVFDFDKITSWGDYYARKNIKYEGKIPPGLVSDLTVYIYRLALDDAIFEKQVKPNFKNISALQNYDYPLEYVARIQLQTSGSVAETGTNSTGPTNDYAALAKNAFNRISYLIEARLEDFKVRTPLVENKSGLDGKNIQAEIGQRESLLPEQRYFVYEYRMGKDSVVYAKRKGVLRATRQIADNRKTLRDANGNYLRSKFRQIHGGRLDEGMFLVQHNDRGFSIAAGYAQRNSSNFQIRGDYALSRLFSFLPDNSKVFLELAFGKTDLENSTTHFGYGVSTPLNLTRWIDVEPYLGYYAQSFNDSEVAAQNYWNLGVRIPISLSYQVYLTPEASVTTQEAIFSTTSQSFNYGLMLRVDF